MAIDIKVIPTLHGDEAIRFINNADEVMKSKERVNFSEKIAIARAILKKADSQKESLKAGVVVGYTSSKLWKDGKD